MTGGQSAKEVPPALLVFAVPGAFVTGADAALLHGLGLVCLG